MAGGFVVAIPARFASTRLPGKPLRQIAGRTLIEHVHARARESGADEVIVAADDQRIREAAEGFGARVVMTAGDHPSGTDRLAEVARVQGWPAERVVVNLQGDEPLVSPALIRRLADDLSHRPEADIATLATPVRSAAELFDPHVVKVVVDQAGYALYFSRAPIPWERDAFRDTTERLPQGSQHLRHIGLYAYRAGFLARYADLRPCHLERAEALEQLRALWSGARIHVGIIAEAPGHGVDTEADLARVAALLEA